MSAPEPRRCVAPTGETEGEDAILCGEPATTTREIAGVVASLCAAHAAEIDADTMRGEDAAEGD